MKRKTFIYLGLGLLVICAIVLCMLKINHKRLDLAHHLWELDTAVTPADIRFWGGDYTSAGGEKRHFRIDYIILAPDSVYRFISWSPWGEEKIIARK